MDIMPEAENTPQQLIFPYHEEIKPEELPSGEEGLSWGEFTDSDLADDDTCRPTIESVIEAVLFASDEPISASRLVNIIGISSVKQVKDAVEALNKGYEDNNSAFLVENIAGGYQMLTRRVYNNWLRKLVRERKETRLTRAALETLSIIAYKQPVIRADIEAVRGVASGDMIRSLMNKGLVKIAGRADILGRPILYGTTKKFLEIFGLSSIDDLPKIEELKNPVIL
jgi:segregation and condensation protein B